VNSSFAGFTIDLPGGLRAGGQTSGAGVQSYSHPDWLGSARTISSVGRTWVGSQAYAPFGEAYAASGSVVSLFTNQYNDQASDLYDFPAREQHRVQGRWISPDPAGLAAADPSSPQSWNRYAYSLNGPTYLLDPLGLQGFKVLQEPSGGNAAWMVFAQGGYSGFFGGDGGYGTINPPPWDWQGTSFDWYLACAGPNSIPYACYGGAATALDANGGSGDSAANNGPVVVKNPCQFQGRALSPSDYATSGQQAANSTTNFVLDVSMGFHAGHYLDPQPLASGNVFQRQAYGNYTFGVYMAGAGVSLNTALSGANTYAFFFSSYPKSTPMDPNYGSLPAASVTNIRNGYNAYTNGTVCHN
jgi:RHS repeat-associated protein